MCTDLHFACMEAFYTFLSLLQLRKQQHGQSRRKEIAAVARAVFVEDGEELFMNVSFGSLSDGFRVRLTPEKYPSSKGKQIGRARYGSLAEAVKDMPYAAAVKSLQLKSMEEPKASMSPSSSPIKPTVLLDSLTDADRAMFEQMEISCTCSTRASTPTPSKDSLAAAAGVAAALSSLTLGDEPQTCSGSGGSPYDPFEEVSEVLSDCGGSPKDGLALVLPCDLGAMFQELNHGASERFLVDINPHLRKLLAGAEMLGASEPADEGTALCSPLGSPPPATQFHWSCKLTPPESPKS